MLLGKTILRPLFRLVPPSNLNCLSGLAAWTSAPFSWSIESVLISTNCDPPSVVAALSRVSAFVLCSRHFHVLIMTDPFLRVSRLGMDLHSTVVSITSVENLLNLGFFQLATYGYPISIYLYEGYACLKSNRNVDLALVFSAGGVKNTGHTSLAFTAGATEAAGCTSLMTVGSGET